MSGFASDSVSQRSVAGVLLVLSAVQAFVIGCAAWSHGPTMNEPAHLASGLHRWHTGNNVAYRVNPPLVRTIATAPVYAFADHQVDWTGYRDGPGARPEFEFGANFVAANAMATMDFLRVARLTLLPLVLLATPIAYLWANDVGGRIAGLLAAALTATSPLLSGHASLITPDAVAASLGVAAGYAIWKMRPDRVESALLAGVVIGLALAAKTTHVILLPIATAWLLGLSLSDRLRSLTLPASAPLTGIGNRAIAGFGSVIVLCITTLITLNLFYGFDDPGQRLGDFRFVSGSFGGTSDARGITIPGNRWENSPLASVPVPLPVDFVLGIDQQRKDFEGYSNPSYLFGRFSDRGWYHYYVWVVLLKAPLGTLALSAFAIGWLSLRLPLFFRQSPRCTIGLVFAMALSIAYFLLVSSQAGFSHHGRYVLPAVVPWFVAIAAIVSDAVRRQAHKKRPLFVSSLVMTCLIATMVASLSVTPHQIAFFNRLAGGSRGGPRYLLHSNIDWGQDLLRLRGWASKLPVHRRDIPIFLAYQETYNPFPLLSGRFQPWPRSLREPSPGFDGIDAIKARPRRHGSAIDVIVPDGYYAVSLNFLHGVPRSLCDRDGLFFEPDRTVFKTLLGVEPVARCGASIVIFDAGQLRRAIGRPPQAIGRPPQAG